MAGGGAGGGAAASGGAGVGGSQSLRAHACTVRRIDIFKDHFWEGLGSAT